MRYSFSDICRIVVLVFILAGLSACSSSAGQEPAPKGAAGEGEVKIGVCLPVTGPLADYGKCQWNALNVAGDIVPVAGGKNVKLVLRDTFGKKVGMVASGLVDVEGVSAVVAWENDPILDDLASERDIPCVITSKGRPLHGHHSKYLYSVRPSDVDQARIAAEFAKEGLDAAGVAIVLDQKDSGSVRLASYFSAEFIRLGGEISNFYFVRDGKTGLENVSDFDVLYCPCADEKCFSIVKLARKQGVKVPILVSNLLREEEFVDDLSRSEEGVYLVSAFSRDVVISKRAGDIVKRYEKSFGRFDSCAALASDAYLLLADGFDLSSRGMEMEDAMVSLRGIEYLSGMVVMNGDGHPSRYMHISRARRSGITRIDSLMAR